MSRASNQTSNDRASRAQACPSPFAIVDSCTHDRSCREACHDREELPFAHHRQVTHTRSAGPIVSGIERDTHPHRGMGECISVRTAKSEDLYVEGGISLAERFMLLLVVFEDPLQVPYALILPFPIGSLRSSVLCSPSLLSVRKTCGLKQLLKVSNPYREDRGRRVLVPVLTLPLWRGLVGLSGLGRRWGNYSVILLFYRWLRRRRRRRRDGAWVYLRRNVEV